MNPGEPAVRSAIPEHELVRPIASGAYGEVWLAGSALGTWRAVKIVRRDRFERGEDFEREFRGLQRFEPLSRTHEALVDVLQIGRQEHWFYYVMELADDAGANSTPVSPKEIRNPKSEVEARGGGARPSELGVASSRSAGALRAFDCYAPRTLRAELKRRSALPADEVIALGVKLANGLAHLHGNGLVHRDVKPSNILFIGGAPKLADAGLVAAVDEAQSLVGTPGYIPPEGPGTPQADIYSFGKVLYEAAFGKDRSEFPQLPPDLSAREDHSKLLELNEILLTACAKNPAQRYRSAEELLADLEFLQRGHSVKRKHTLGARWKLVRQISLGAMAAALVGAAVTFTLHQAAQNRPLSRNRQAVHLDNEAVQVLQQQTTAAARVAYTNLTNAVALDPRFTAAHYMLFEVNFNEWGEHLPPYFDAYKNMKSMATNLWKLNPDSAEYHTVNSWLDYCEWRFEEGIKEAQRAIEVNPKFPRAHGFYATYLLRFRGDPEQARREFEIAADLDDRDIIYRVLLGRPDYFERKFDQAIKLFSRANQLQGGGGGADDLARCYEAKGDYKRAIDFYEAAELQAGVERAAVAANYEEQREALKQGGARAWYQTKLKQLQQAPRQDPYQMAKLYARLNDTNQVFSWLERGYKEQEGHMDDLLVDDCWDTLRDDPHFRDIVRRMGMSQRTPEAKGTNAVGARLPR